MSSKMSKPKLPQRYQNTVNNAQGHIFEQAILQACGRYAARDLAVIDKTPDPFRVMAKFKDGIFKGRFTAPAQPDFQGTLKGGQSIVFEAKYTTTDRLRREVLTSAQMAALEQHRKLGALAFVCAGIKDRFAFVPWPVWRDMKKYFGRQYVTEKDILPWRVKFDGAVLFLDYESVLLRDYFLQEKAAGGDGHNGPGADS